ncbi:hypothetical protein PF004_g4134 [Phytophthora fragariae]|uniref:Pectate lyase n=1 Tax=Phytophthora fragariae TaxID=53985 RepID=A0A6G0PJG7_9STRA|nr:hypothetical protein PF004_g4134 [Phytophthora fragariae]
MLTTAFAAAALAALVSCDSSSPAGVVSSPDSWKSPEDKALAATDCSASAGHSLNQSIVQQFTSDGNIRMRSRNRLPSGLMHSTRCRF